ncbi:MAG: YraN family protein, partial [Thermoanaerobaculia bacterium]
MQSGREGEDAAALLLEENSLRILDRNVRYRDGEIDIVALDGATTVFVEVKRRRSVALGAPAEA